MTDSSAFPKLVPGFDFLQNLVKNAGAALPGIGSWVAPTIDPAEIEKRIEELRTVQFWLEQNARMIGATIQALEVQRMTLSTLTTMNVQMEDLRDALQIRLPTLSTPAPPPAAPPPEPVRAAPPPAEAAPAGPAAAALPPSGSAAGVVDPLKWWGALTQQFTELATNAMQNSAVEARRAAPSGPPAPSPAGAATKSRRRAATAKDKDAPAPAKKASPRR